MALPTSSSPPRASTWRAGRPVMTATARVWAASATSTSGASGWMCAASGSSTIGASVPSKSSPTTRSSAARTTAAYCCSPPDETNSTPPLWQSGPLPVVVVGEDHRDAVEVHRVLGGADLADPQVAAESPGRGLELRWEEDAGGVDGPVPVVG